MRKPQYLAAFLNLITVMGGFFYLRRPYRAIILGLVCLAGPTILTIVYFELLQDVIPLEIDPARQYQTLLFFNLALLTTISALVALFSTRAEPADEARGWRWAAAALFSLAGAGMVVAITTQYLTPIPSPEAMKQANAQLQAEGDFTRYHLTYAGFVMSGDDFEPFGDESRITGQATLDGEPLANVEFRANTNFRETSGWVTTNENGNFSFPADVDKKTFVNIDVRNESLVDAAALTVITGLETPYDGEGYSTFDIRSGDGLLVRVYRDGTSDPLHINFVTLLSPRPVDLADTTPAELANTQISWQEVDGATEYLVKISRHNEAGDRTTLLMERSLTGPAFSLEGLVEDSSPPAGTHHEVFIAAFNAKGELLNYSRYDTGIRLVLPQGWSIKDVYESPCERRAREKAANE